MKIFKYPFILYICIVLLSFTLNAILGVKKPEELNTVLFFDYYQCLIFISTLIIAIMYSALFKNLIHKKIKFKILFYHLIICLLQIVFIHVAFLSRYYTFENEIFSINIVLFAMRYIYEILLIYTILSFGSLLGFKLYNLIHKQLKVLK